MTIAAIVLMSITSAGAFGYLSAQFQKAISSTNESSVVITALADEQTRLQKRKEEIDTQIAKLPGNMVAGRRSLMKQFAPEVEQINTRLVAIDTELPKLKVETLKQNVEVGPIIYIAEAFHTTPAQAVKWVILIIIFVFDPLAITLLLSGNFLFEQKGQERINIQIRKLEIPPDPSLKKDDDITVVPASEAFTPTTSPPAVANSFDTYITRYNVTGAAVINPNTFSMRATYRDQAEIIEQVIPPTPEEPETELPVVSGAEHAPVVEFSPIEEEHAPAETPAVFEQAHIAGEREIIKLNQLMKNNATQPIIARSQLEDVVVPIHRSQLEDVTVKGDVLVGEGALAHQPNTEALRRIYGDEAVSIGGPSDRV
jgi:hypothetical protein